jgi:hypothetical protein
MSEDKDVLISQLTKNLEHWRREVEKKQSQIDNLKFELEMLWVLVNKDAPESVVEDMRTLGTGIMQGDKRVDPKDFYINDSKEKTTSKHTPGPWVSSHYDDIADEIAIQTHEGEYVASIDCDGAYGGKIANCIDANARLIATAPDLLEALEDVLDGIGFLSGGDYELEGFGISLDRAKEIRAAIAKARGENYE